MFAYDLELKTKHGIEKLDIMVNLISVIEAKPNKCKYELKRFNSFLVKKIKRDLTPQEEIDFMEGMVKYIQSDAATNERLNSMNYLFNLEFLTNPTPNEDYK